MDESMKIPEPWKCGDCVHHRRCAALYGVKGDEPTCDFAPSRFRLDTIGTLCRLVKKAGLTMTLFGKPVEEEELRGFAYEAAGERLRSALKSKGSH